MTMKRSLIYFHPRATHNNIYERSDCSKWLLNRLFPRKWQINCLCEQKRKVCISISHSDVDGLRIERSRVRRHTTRTQSNSFERNVKMRQKQQMLDDWWQSSQQTERKEKKTSKRTNELSVWMRGRWKRQMRRIIQIVECVICALCSFTFLACVRLRLFHSISSKEKEEKHKKKNIYTFFYFAFSLYLRMLAHPFKYKLFAVWKEVLCFFCLYK